MTRRGDGNDLGVLGKVAWKPIGFPRMDLHSRRSGFEPTDQKWRWLVGVRNVRNILVRVSALKPAGRDSNGQSIQSHGVEPQWRLEQVDDVGGRFERIDGNERGHVGPAAMTQSQGGAGGTRFWEEGRLQ